VITAGGAAPCVLVTGAAAGIGRAAALRLARAGWRCLLVDADAAALQRLVAGWPAACAAPQTVVCDLTDAAQIARLAEALPPLDALVNNAGRSAGGTDALAGDDDGAAAQLLALNLAAPARLVQACTPRLRSGARIVNLASGAGLRAIPWRGLYSASKAGLIAQTLALAQARPDWCVTALSPGFVRTELVQGLIDSGRLRPAQAVAKIPLGRMAEPEDMAEALCFLASPGARPLSGQLLVLDGGSSVYGGSAPLPAATGPALPFDLPTALHCVDVDAPAWRDALNAREATAPAPASDAAYTAVLDGAALDAAPGAVLDAVLRSARRFRAQHAAQASLTLLLPAPAPDTHWTQAGDAAAARMLIATLAAEWGAHGLRINALQTASSTAPSDCLPLLDYIAGARAQFLTGQVLQPGAARHDTNDKETSP
jgi:NAD(P)-dependent dehydrogenase (short-subunit alcohol dehydrogenase family)